MWSWRAAPLRASHSPALPAGLEARSIVGLSPYLGLAQSNRLIFSSAHFAFQAGDPKSAESVEVLHPSPP